ncbi:GIN domain-containing protein [Mucilaginibacter celer]|uniref:Putative auto-transporter adhesin head GIN domain-containing protein n=1 Tax=Mucilaginibacter celer TaxID=2305508 RepID=A0A494VN01_9SPHI|nr:DUF2807 domain-containing protein [Mucilaginibacter celer]AYL94360.1 hypothetical protein HYN43_003185 [Mucilaginibacter celer]
MKTQILSFIAMMIMVSGLTQNASANTFKDDNFTVLNDISAINKIEVRGNVELFISDGNMDRVKVYNKYYAENALVQSRNGVLRISNYKAEKLVIWVSASDLRSVSAFDNSSIQSFGKLFRVEFSIDLHDAASAKLDLDVYAAELTVKDHAKVELSGAADELTMDGSERSSLGTGFAVAHFNEIRPVVTAKLSDEVFGM